MIVFCLIFHLKRHEPLSKYNAQFHENFSYQNVYIYIIHYFNDNIHFGMESNCNECVLLGYPDNKSTSDSDSEKLRNELRKKLIRQCRELRKIKKNIAEFYNNKIAELKRYHYPYYCTTCCGSLSRHKNKIFCNTCTGSAYCSNECRLKDMQKLKACARCFIARYCCKRCQISDWESHKKECEQICRMKKILSANVKQ